MILSLTDLLFSCVTQTYQRTKIVQAIDPKKTLMDFIPVNVGRMALNLPCYLPATPFRNTAITFSDPESKLIGKHCVVIGRSNIVGSPMSILLTRNANPEIVPLLFGIIVALRIFLYFTKQADIIVLALGNQDFSKEKWLKTGLLRLMLEPRALGCA